MSIVPQPENNNCSWFNDRLYSTFGVINRIHCVPVDEEEEQLSDEFNALLRELLGRTVIPPIPFEDIDEPCVLDCGFGKGAWIDDLLGAYNSQEILVTGVDIFTGRGTTSDEEDEEEQGGVMEFERERWNMNETFQRSTLSPKSFDLINSRMLADGLNAPRWPSYIHELYQLLKPAGWVQMVEPQFLFQSDAGKDLPFLHHWWTSYANALRWCNKDARVGTRLHQHLTTAGFEAVWSYPYRLPIGTWDPSVGLGSATLELFKQILYSHSAWLFMHTPGGMTPPEHATLLRGALAELLNPSFRIYIHVHVAIGRRPLDSD